MKSSSSKPVFAEERKMAILKHVTTHGPSTVAELSSLFNVSPTTIRNDLRELERHDYLIRTHGGAMPHHQTGAETTLDVREVENVTAKQAIAKVALECIEDGDTLILDVGTTTYELARLLAQQRSVKIVTNDLKIALLTDEFPNLNVFMLGGRIRAGYHCSVGTAAVRALSAFAADRVFLGTNGFDVHFGASTPDSEQAEMKHAMLTAASKNYILCDSTKFGKRSLVRFAEFSEIDALITDVISAGDTDTLESAGIEVYSASSY